MALLVQSGPLAPCKIEHAVLHKSPSRAAMAPDGSSCCRQGRAVDGERRADPDPDCDGSCWCSLHLSSPDVAVTVTPPLFVCVLTPPALDRRGQCDQAAFESFALDPPEPTPARIFPLLI